MADSADPTSVLRRPLGNEGEGGREGSVLRNWSVWCFKQCLWAEVAGGQGEARPVKVNVSFTFLFFHKYITGC